MANLILPEKKLILPSAPLYLPNIKIKGRGFCPNPIARYGIPAYADSVAHPEVVGTSAHQEWWYEQFDLFDNGYTSGGSFIPGRFYYYLNFHLISTVGRGLHLPDYVDTDQDFYEGVEEAKRIGWGLMIPKARRRGLSEKSGGLMRHGCLVRPEKYRAVIVAGVERYSDELFQKFALSNSNMPPEMQVNAWDTSSQLEMKLGWDEQDPVTRKWKKAGSMNFVSGLTVKNDPNIVKGSAIDDLFYEESGENQRLMATRGAAKSCLADGDFMVGTEYIYGTGGNIKAGSKDFKDLLYNAEANRLLVLRIYGPQLRKPYYIGATNKDNEVEYDCPNIDKFVKENNLSIEQVLGCEDTVHGTAKILAARKELIKQPNKKPFYDSLQNDPLNDSEAFLSFSGNEYSPEKLSEQELMINESDPKVFKYIPSWKKDENGKLMYPLSVVMTPVPDYENPDAYILVKRDPVRGYRNLYGMGVDSYDIDKSATSKSLGSAVIIARRNNAMIPYGEIQAVIRCRPERKEIFYQLCMMASVHWGCLESTMVDARSPLIIDTYINHGLERYLAKRPTGFDTARSLQDHEFGFKMTVGTVLNSVISMIQTWVVDCVKHCWFIEVIQDVRDFDVEHKDSDWDAHDALGLALICDFSIGSPAINMEHAAYDPFQTLDWSQGKDGRMQATNTVHLDEEYGAPEAAEILESIFRGQGFEE